MGSLSLFDQVPESKEKSGENGETGFFLDDVATPSVFMHFCQLPQLQRPWKKWQSMQSAVYILLNGKYSSISLRASAQFSLDL